MYILRVLRESHLSVGEIRYACPCYDFALSKLWCRSPQLWQQCEHWRCKTRLCCLCYIQEYPPLNGCNAEVLWGHIFGWRARSRSGYSIAAFRPWQPWKCVGRWKRTAFFSPHCSRSRYSSLWLEYYHLRLLSVDHSNVVDVWELLGYFPLSKYPLQRQCFWYLLCGAP